MSDDIFYVGGGEMFLQVKDRRVLNLIRCVHRYFSPSTPVEIYEDVVSETQNVKPPILCDDIYIASSTSIAKLKTMSLHDVHPGLLKLFGTVKVVDDASFLVGDRQRAFRFPNHEYASLVLSSLQPSVTGENVVHAVADFVIHNASEILGVSVQTCTLSNRDAFVAISAAESELFTIGRASWHSIYERVGEETTTPLQENIPVIQGKHAMICHLFYHHWCIVTPTCIAHRSVPDCYLHYKRYGFCNDIVVLDASYDNSFWWISDVSIKINSRLESIIFKREESLMVTRPLKKEPIVSPSTIPDIVLPECKRLRTTVEKWTKSANAPGLSAPFLVRYLEPPTFYEVDGWCAQRKKETVECIDCGLFSILSEEFGPEYAKESLDRALSDPFFGVYAAKDANNANVVATFIVCIFEAVFVDGMIGSALMIDSFAVKHSLQGQGIGGKVFHNLCRGIAMSFAEEDIYKRHAMFAQCLTSKRPRDFWFDKLDDAGIARALLLQASALHASRVPIQTTCCAKARVYYGSTTPSVSV
jgi:hypothetical protein